MWQHQPGLRPVNDVNQRVLALGQSGFDPRRHRTQYMFAVKGGASLIAHRKITEMDWRQPGDQITGFAINTKRRLFRKILARRAVDAA